MGTALGLRRRLRPPRRAACLLRRRSRRGRSYRPARQPWCPGASSPSTRHRRPPHHAMLDSVREYGRGARLDGSRGRRGRVGGAGTPTGSPTSPGSSDVAGVGPVGKPWWLDRLRRSPPLVSALSRPHPRRHPACSWTCRCTSWPPATSPRPGAVPNRCCSPTTATWPSGLPGALRERLRGRSAGATSTWLPACSTGLRADAPAVEQGGNLGLVETVAGADTLRAGEAEAADEDREPCPQQLLRR